MLKPLLIAGALLASAPAFACQYDFAPEPVGGPSGTFIARKMFDSASFADLAVAEHRRPFVAAGKRGMPDVVTFRTVRRFKGSSPDRFTLFAEQGQAAVKDRGEELAHWVDDDGVVRPHRSRQELVPAENVGLSSCDPGFITPELGRLYIIFRGADGRALRMVRYRDQPVPAAFPVVAAGEPRRDAWHDSVFLESFKHKPGTVFVPPDLPVRGDVARILFRTPQPAAAVAKLLRSAGAAPFAVRVAAGEFIDESRVPARFADVTLVAQAVAAARDNLQTSRLSEAATAALARADELPNDGWLQERAIDIVNAEARLRRARLAGPLLVASVEVAGSDAGWARLRSSPLVAELSGGMDYYREPALPPVATRVSAVDLAWGVKPEVIVARLRAVAQP